MEIGTGLFFVGVGIAVAGYFLASSILEAVQYVVDYLERTDEQG